MLRLVAVAPERYAKRLLAKNAKGVKRRETVVNAAKIRICRRVAVVARRFARNETGDAFATIAETNAAKEVEVAATGDLLERKIETLARRMPTRRPRWR